MLIILIVTALVAYFGGYFADQMREGANIPKYFKQLVKPPKYLFLICGAPRSEKYPAGIMVAGALANQLLGIGTAIYAVIFYYTNQTTTTFLLSLGIILITAYSIPYLLSRKYRGG